MESDLKFHKEGDKFILTDVSTYTAEGLVGLYDTFKATVDLKEHQEVQVTKQLNQIREEKVIINKRFDQVKQYMELEGIAIPEDVKEE